MLVHGGLPQEVREQNIAGFQSTPFKRAALFATIDSLKEGVTLHKANHVVLHDLSWVPSDVLQAEARVHRIGQTRGCTSTWVLCEDSFDTIVARHVARKAREISEVLQDGAAEGAVDELNLTAVVGDTSMEDEARRLLQLWEDWA